METELYNKIKMNNREEKFLKKSKKLYYIVFVLVAISMYGSSFLVAKATLSLEEMEAIKNMSEEERQSFMQTRGENQPQLTNGEFSKQEAPNSMREEGMENSAQKLEELEQRIIKAKSAFDRNRTRLRVARNIATSTVAQLKIEGTDVGELLANLKDFEERMDEIEGLYENYLNQLLLLERDRGDDPGSIDTILKQAKEKRVELVAFYKNTFRKNFEEALIKNEESKK